MSKNFSEDLVSSMFLDDQGDDTHPSVTECQQFLYADPRIKYFFEFAAGIESINDLSEGMVLPGIVTNITQFGTHLIRVS